MFRKESVKDLPFLIIGCLILIAALYPYWIFGSFSNLGWYDEFHAIIPWYFSKNGMEFTDGFMHGYAGGTGSSLGFVYGNEWISLYRGLVQYFDFWIAQLLTRFLSFTCLYTGVYFFLRCKFGVLRVLAFSAGLFCVLVSNIPYGWSVGGAGWDLGIIAWLCIVFFCNFKSRWQHATVTIIVSLVASITCAPNFLLPLAGYMFLFCIFVLEERVHFNKEKLVIWGGVWFIFLTFLIINWFDAQHSIIAAKEFSARILGTLKPVDTFVINASLYDKFVYFCNESSQVFDAFSNRQPNPLLEVGYLLVSLFAVWTRKISHSIYFFCFIYIIPILLDAMAKLSGVDLIANYRWTILWHQQPLMISFFLSYLTVMKGGFEIIFGKQLSVLPVKLIRVVKLIINQTSLILIAAFFMTSASILAAARLIDVTLINLNATGGLGVIESYNGLKKLKHTKGKYRFISADAETSGVIPLFYSLDTFDGMLTNFPSRRNYFLAYAAYEPLKESLHTHSHFFGSFPKGYDMEMFRMVNVRYIISGKKMNDNRVELIDTTDAVFANDLNYSIKQYVKSNFSDLRLLNPLYIYEIKGAWPRVFAAKRVEFSHFSYKSKRLYTDLKKLNFSEILIADEDIPEDKEIWLSHNQLKIKKYGLSERGVDFDVAETGGIIVFNQVYTSSWRAECSGNEIPLIPANGVMMAMLVPTGCTTPVLRYE